MEINIYSQDGTLKLTASPGSGGQCVKQLQGDSELSLSFDYFSYVALDVNDYVDFCGDRYWLLEQYRPKEVSTIQWRYDVKLYGIESLIKRYLVIEHTDGDANPVFTLTAPASQHMRMIVECLNNATGTTDWQLGTVLTTGNITIDYTGKYCDEGLRELAEAANTEYWFSGDNGKTLNLCRCERGETIELKYGVGLISLERDVADNAKFYTRLYPVGSSRNINPETYGHTRLQLPNNQKYVDLDIAKYGVIDHYEKDAFSGIFPRYTGTVSTVRVEDRTDEDGTEFKVYFIKDASLPFNPNNFLLPNEKIRISFQTGDLQGLGETDDHYFEADYNSTTGEFEIINIWTDGEQLPRPGLEPETGNSYIPWNISMPQTYITRAEQELAAAVSSYNQAHFVDNSVYRGTTNHVWIEADQSRNIYIGRLVKLVSSQYFPGTGYRNSRIVKITRRLDLPSQMELEISDAVSTGTLTKINDDIRGVWDFVKGLETDDNGKWLSKRHNDTAQGLIRFIRGLQVGERFVTGLLGEGGIFRKEADGTTYIEADKLYIRMKAYFDSVEIRDYKHSAGNRIQSPAGAKCCRVEWIDASGNSLRQTDENLSNTVLFRCYFRGSDGEDEVRNNFVIGDQAYCHVTTVETEDDSPQAKGLNMKHYWRLVVGRNANGTLTDDGEHWIDLSNKVSETLVIGGTSYTRSGYQSGSDVPEATDDIIQLGNINDTDRQGAIIEFVTGADAPSYQIFQGINSFNLNGKNYIGLGYSTQTGRAYLNVYGDTFIGAMPDEYGNSPTYLKYNAGTRSLEIKAKIDAQSTIDGETLAEFIAQNTWTEEQIDALITAGTEPLEDAIEEIQRQVDGSIATWFYDGVPTLNNQPASGWTTAELKNEHLGDLYYDNLTGYAYRFKYDDANRQWSWGRITDVDVTKALADAAKAQDTADHKRRIFVVQPTPPYDQGDLWVNATYPSGNTETNAAQNKYYNDVLRCNTTKASGTSFAIADWGLASKYTDDQALLDFKANQYVQQLTNGTLNQGISNAQSAASQASLDAAAAQTAADNAQADADAANDRLDDWADDGVISPTEKTSLKVDWEDMKKEYVQICNDADKYSVSKTAFASAYTSANAAFQKYTASTPENITIGSDYANIAAYYAARQTIMDAISVAAKKVATDAQTAADAAGLTASSALTAAQAAEAHAATMDAVKQALNQGTLIDGGLVLSTFIGLRDANNTLWSGISGAYSTTGAYGGGLAAWFGGGHVDRRNSDGTWNNVGAKVGFRFDGSGYVAGGAISWDATGLTKVTASKISALEIDLNGDEVATESWVSDNFVSITFFERLFKAYNGSTIVHPNSTSTIDNIKAMFGFWTEQYISALGQGSGGSSGVGDVTWDLLASSSDTRPIALSHLTGALSGYATQSWVNSQISGMSTSLAGLSDVNVSGVTSGQYLKFNGQGWVPDTPSGSGGTVTAVKVGTTTYNPSSGVVSLPAYPSTANLVSGISIGGGNPITPTSGIVGLPAYPTVPTKVSQLTNDSGYVTSSSLSGYLPLAGGSMEGTIKWSGNMTRQILSFAPDNVIWKSGLKYSWSSKTTIALWGTHTGTQFVWNAGMDASSEDIDGLQKRDYDFQVGRNSSDVLQALVGGHIIYHQGNLTNVSQLNNDAGYITANGATKKLLSLGRYSYSDFENDFSVNNVSYKLVSNGSVLGDSDYQVLYLPWIAGDYANYLMFGANNGRVGVKYKTTGTVREIITSSNIGEQSVAFATNANGLVDGDHIMTSAYNKSGLTTTYWFAAWNSYELRAISPAATKTTLGLDKVNNTADSDKTVKNSHYLLSLNVNGDAWYDTQYRIHAQWDDSAHVRLKTKDGTFDVRVSASDKLVTARTIWGQNFDGTANISGAIYLTEDTPHYFRGPNNASWRGGIYWGTNGNEAMSFVAANANTKFLIVNGNDISSWSNSTHTTVTPLMSVGTNVGIGVLSPSYKLHVNGTFYASGNSGIGGTLDASGVISSSGGLFVINDSSNNTHDALAYFRNYSASDWSIIIDKNKAYDYGLQIKCSGGYAMQVYGGCIFANNVMIGKDGLPSYKLHVAGTGYFENNLLVQSVEIGNTNEINATGSTTLYLQYRNTGNLVLCNNGKNVGIGVSPSYKLHVSGDVYATGGVTCLSDIREKNILGQTRITVEQIAMMPSVVYRWKDNGNGRDEHVGSIAQDWQNVLPQVVLTAKDEKKTLSMQYGVAALVSAITIARKVVDHERRIKELEDENRKLKEQLKIA